MIWAAFSVLLSPATLNAVGNHRELAHSGIRSNWLPMTMQDAIGRVRENPCAPSTISLRHKGRMTSVHVSGLSSTIAGTVSIPAVRIKVHCQFLKRAPTGADEPLISRRTVKSTLKSAKTVKFSQDTQFHLTIL